MWYALIIVFIIAAVLFGTRFFCGTNQHPTEISILNSDGVVSSPNDSIKAMFSKEQINKKLKRLAKTKPPENLAYGAKCYSIAVFNNQVLEYVCPVCGEKTIYKRNKNEEKFRKIEKVLQFDLETCRRQIEQVKGVYIKLDESHFCSNCMPETDNPSLCLLVNIAGQKDTAKVCNIHSEDIIILREFLEDQLVHKGTRDEEYPMVYYTDRLKQLLGL